MVNFKYLIQFLLIGFIFLIFKLFGPKLSSNIGGKIFEFIGPVFRSKKIIHSNIKGAYPNIDTQRINKITKSMWNNYGRVFAEYMFIKDFRDGNLQSNIVIKGQKILDDIKNNQKQVVFISGHLGNFELMAMHLDRSGIKLSAIYRPLNNFYLNNIMERIRRKIYL